MRSQQLLAGGRVPGNREVSRLFLLAARINLNGVPGTLNGARGEAYLEEGGSWGKHGFPRGSEATREEMLRALREAEERAREKEKVGTASA